MTRRRRLYALYYAHVCELDLCVCSRREQGEGGREGEEGEEGGAPVCGPAAVRVSINAIIRLPVPLRKALLLKWFHLLPGGGEGGWGWVRVRMGVNQRSCVVVGGLETCGRLGSDQRVAFETRTPVFSPSTIFFGLLASLQQNLPSSGGRGDTPTLPRHPHPPPAPSPFPASSVRPVQSGRIPAPSSPDILTPRVCIARTAGRCA